jgi:protein-S-isoprenylcysteine O-methyltransferase Ste14
LDNIWRLYFIYFAIVILLPVTDTYFLKKYRKNLQNRQTVDKRSLKILWGCLALGLFVAVMTRDFQISQVGLRRPIIAILSILLMLGGILIRCWAIVSLGHSFSANIEISSDQQLATKGPYKLIRHPAYSGLLIFLYGWGLTFENWIGVFGVFGFPFAAILYRIKIEEEALKSFFGDIYFEYIKRTKLLIPYIF